MSQCVPSWVDIDEQRPNPNLLHPGKDHEQPFRQSSGDPLVPLTDYEVTELTWQNGQLALHCIRPSSGGSAVAWSKHQQPSETLEAVVNQATGRSNLFAAAGGASPDKHVAAAAADQAAAVDALVPCREDSASGMIVSGARKRPRGVCSSQGSAAPPPPLAVRPRAESTLVTLDSCGLTTTTATNSISPEASPETDNTSFGYESNINSRRSQPKLDEVCEEDAKARKKNRAAAVHNQSERQPMTLDGYNRMATLFQQFYQQQPQANPN